MHRLRKSISDRKTYLAMAVVMMAVTGCGGSQSAAMEYWNSLPADEQESICTRYGKFVAESENSGGQLNEGNFYTILNVSGIPGDVLSGDGGQEFADYMYENCRQQGMNEFGS